MLIIAMPRESGAFNVTTQIWTTLGSCISAGIAA